MNHIGTVEITTDRLKLRRFTVDDVDSFYECYVSDPKVHTYVNYVQGKTREAAEEFIRGIVAQYDKDPAFYAWALTQDGNVFGYVGLCNIDEKSDSAELRFTFGSKWWGHGFSTESTGAVRDLAFKRIGFHRLYSDLHIDNVSSGSVLLKLGMEPEGVLRGAYKNEDGTYSDMKQFGMVAEDLDL